jgi:hypothetical protein
VGSAHRGLRRGAILVQQIRQKGRDAGAGLESGERFTLELGSFIVLSTLGLGMRVGGWPAWSTLFAISGYFTWVVGYSEATVQARRWRPSDHLAMPTASLSADPAATPAHEESAT